MRNAFDYRGRGTARPAGKRRTTRRSPAAFRARGLFSILSRNIGFIALMLLAAAGGWSLIEPKIAEPQLVARLPVIIAPKPATRGETVSRHFPICGSGPRRNCVVDGDTFWLAGEKIRIADINTPEVSQPGCAAEAKLGARATRRLQELLNAGSFEVREGSRDQDQYGRKLRTLHRNGSSLGGILVAEGLAHEWAGYKQSWCG